MMGEEDNDNGAVYTSFEFKDDTNNELALSASIRSRINNLQEQLLGNLSQKTLNGILETIDILKSSAMANEFLKVGDTAPGFTLPNAIGQEFSLSEMLKQDKVVLCFIRGGWCPYCYLELRGLQELLPEIEACGARVIAISSERSDYCLNTMERNGLKFEVLSDKGNRVAQKYNLVYKSEALSGAFSDTSLRVRDDITYLRGDVDLLDELGLNDAISNGDISYELPVPATYIIDQDQIIRYAYADPDYRKRAEPVEVLKVLQSL